MDLRRRLSLDLITGSPADLPLPHRILNLLCFLGLVQGVYFFVSDTLVGQPWANRLFDLANLLLFALLTFEARFRKRFFPANHLVALGCVVLPQVNFFVNAGIDGPGLVAVLGLILLANVLHPGRAGVVYTVAALVLSVVSVGVQAAWPGLIPGYQQPEGRPLDFVLTLVVCAGLLVFVLRMVLQFQIETLERAAGLQASAARSEQMAILGQMVAGIGHEIGTPAGVLGSALSTGEEWYREGLARWQHLDGRWSADERQAFWTLVADGLEVGDRPILDSRAGRTLRASLTQTLTDAGVEEARLWADDLVTLNLGRWNPAWNPLARGPVGKESWNLAVNLLQQERAHRLGRRAHERIQSLLAALASYSRTDPGDDAPVLTDLASGLDTVLTLYAAAHKNRIEIVRRWTEVPPVAARPEALLQVWTNLVQNAIHAMPEGGTLTVSLHRERLEAVVAIEDTGPGVPPELRDKVFQLFFTTKDRGSGTGIGLGLVKKIVTAHGGTVAVGDAAGGGARFEVRLPI